MYHHHTQARSLGTRCGSGGIGCLICGSRRACCLRLMHSNFRVPSIHRRPDPLVRNQNTTPTPVTRNPTIKTLKTILTQLGSDPRGVDVSSSIDHDWSGNSDRDELTSAAGAMFFYFCILVFVLPLRSRTRLQSCAPSSAAHIKRGTVNV